MEIINGFELTGIHHVTAVTSSAQKIYEFFTNVLGLRLAKKTVNQDDYSTYHLYFTDELGTPGTDMTFFDFQGARKGGKGKNSIDRTSFRVPSDSSVDYWKKRLSAYEVANGEIYELFGKKAFDFEDFDGQRYRIISDEKNSGMKGGLPWKHSSVPQEHAIIGLGAVTLVLDSETSAELLLGTILGLSKKGQEGTLHLYEAKEGGTGAAVIADIQPELPLAYQGYGNVHHLAFRVADQQMLEYWIERIKSMRLSHSGFVDRFYFQSEYFMSIRGVLIELATDGPGFWQDEPEATAGENLSLPSHLFSKDEAEKAAATSALRQLDTSDANQQRVETVLI
jgi:glyoxalase family protein